MPKDEEKEQERAPQRGPEEALMARLRRVVAALEEQAELVRQFPGPAALAPQLPELQLEERVTPDRWEDIALAGKRPAPGHVVALIAANAFIDAHLLGCPGTSKSRAAELVDRLLDEQREHGMFHAFEGDSSSDNMDEWEAAMAAVLYVSRRAGLPLIEERAAGWWRQLLDSPLGAIRTEILDFIQRGERRADPFLPARLFYLMENVPLPKPAQPWKVVV